MLFGMQETMIYKDVMIKGRRCPEIGCTETYAHCYMFTVLCISEASIVISAGANILSDKCTTVIRCVA